MNDGEKIGMAKEDETCLREALVQGFHGRQADDEISESTLMDKQYLQCATVTE